MAVAVVTQFEVAADSPAFTRPTKPIGSFMDEATAHARAPQEGWTIREDAGRGWRPRRAQPRPLAIVEIEAIRHAGARRFRRDRVARRHPGRPNVRGDCTAWKR